MDLRGAIELGLVGVDVEAAEEEFFVLRGKAFVLAVLVDEGLDDPADLLVGDGYFGGSDAQVGGPVQEVFGKDLLGVLFFVHDGRS